MHEVHKGQKVLDFVGLDVANHVPTDVLGKTLSFSRQFLDPIFSKVPLSGVVRGHHILVGFGLADCDQGDPPASLGGRLCDLRLHFRQTVSKRGSAHASWNSWMNRALRILGSTHVLFGGNVPWSSATFRMCPKGMG